MFNETVEDTLEEAEALERHVKTVTMRVESLETTDADFFKTLVSRQEEAHLNALSHLSTVGPAANQATKSRLSFIGEMPWKCRSRSTPRPSEPHSRKS